MSLPLLRTLTLKSTLQFGKYREMTVQQVIDLHEINYLIWAYYNCSVINFTDEILEILKITEKISKPGINPELGNKRIQERIKDMPLNIRRKFEKEKRVRKEHKLNRIEKTTNNFSRPDYLLNKNHGH